MSITVLRQLLMKEAVKKSAGSSGIMSINKNIAADVDKLLQKYINDAMQQGVDLDTLSPEQLKMIVAINSKPTNRVISGSSPEGKAITEKLFGKKGGDVNIYSKQYIDNLDKEIIDSGLYTKKEWTNLSDELKEARRRKFDPNYDDAMEGMVESNVVDMTGKNIDTSQGIIGGKSVKELMESGQVQKGTDNIKISEKITDREMFKNSNLNKEPISEKFIDYTIQNMNKMKPIDAMKEANSVIGRKGPYKDLTPEQSKKILQDTEDHIFERDIPDEDFATGGRAGYQNGNQVMPAVDPRMQNTYEQNTKLNQIQRNINERVRKGSKTQGLEIGQLRDMYGKKQTEYNLYNPNLKFNEAQKYGAATNMGLRPEQIKAVAYFNTLKNNFGDQGIGMAGPGMGLAQVGGMAPGTNPFASEKFFKTPAEQFALYQEGLRQQLLQGSPEIYFDRDKTYDAGNYVSPKGIYTFRDDEFLRNLYNNNTINVDGKEYASEQDAIDDMGIERYNQFMAKGGRAGFYTGGITDVEPSLDDIGHGADALNARTRLMSPGNQATTSTGLNYLLAEDNDNMRIPFSGGNTVKDKIKTMQKDFDKYRKGGGKLSYKKFTSAYIPENFAEGGRIGFAAGGGGRRAFLKFLASIGGLTAAAKSGMIGLGEGTTKKAITETVKQATGSGTPPPYFFKLVEKIKMMGDDIGATQDRTIAKSMKSKDGKSEYILEEDVSTGDTLIKKINKESDDMVTDVEIMQHSKGQADELTKGKKPADSYEEVTEYNSRIYKDNFNEPNYVDGIKVDEILEEVGETVTKKADGGRIGFSSGGLLNVLSRLGITGSSRRFLEKAFGKEKFENMIKNDPEMHRGLLEVVEMFRNRDKEGLKMYMQKFLPHMDDVEIEQFIVGSTPDIEGLTGQLTRLGSGRDYAGKLEMMKKADEVKKLQNFDIKNVTKNAEGGRIELRGGGDALKAIINYFAKQSGKKGSEQLRDINPKALGSGIANIMGPEHLKMLKNNQTDYLESLLNIMKSDKKFLNNLKVNTDEAIAQAPIGMEDFAKEITESIKRDAMKGSRFDRMKVYDKIDIDDAIVDVEQMIKNRRVKESDGRALNSSGGLQTMLGE